MSVTRLKVRGLALKKVCGSACDTTLTRVAEEPARVYAGSRPPYLRQPGKRTWMLALPRASSRIDEAVAGTRLGHEVARVRSVGLDLPSQLRDVHMEQVRLVPVDRAPHLLQQHAVGQQLSLVQGKDSKEIELVRRQMHRVSPDSDGAVRDVDHELADSDHRLARRRRPPEDGSQAREQLVDAYGLRHVIVCAGVERSHLLLLLTDGREHDDRSRAPRTEFARDLGPGAVRQ